jgi:hypothetical protein
VRSTAALVSAAALVLIPAPSVEGAGTDGPRFALSVSPPRLELVAPGARRINVRNDGAERVTVHVTATRWVEILPTRLTLRPGSEATVTLRVTRPRRAEPGDHRLLVLLTARPLAGGAVNVQTRLGIRMNVHMRGRIVRRLKLGPLRIRRTRGARLLLVPVVNRGNVSVLLRGQITALLRRRGRQLVRLHPGAPRFLPPGDRSVLRLPYRGRARGRAIAIVRIQLGSGTGVVERRYRVRL